MNHKKKQKPRRSIRLQSYDYSSPGEYFVTMCIQNRRCLFGDVVDGEMRLNRLGRIAWKTWYKIPDRFENVTLDAFVVMPNHVHGIIGIESNPVAAIHELQPQDDLKFDSKNRGANSENRKFQRFDSEKYRIKRRKMLLPKIIGWYKMNVSKQANIIIKKKWVTAFGNEIITNTSSEMTKHYIASGITSFIIHQNGIEKEFIKKVDNISFK